MIRYLTAIVSVLLLSPQLVFAQPDNNYQRQGGYGAPYDSGRDNRQYDPNRGDYSQGGDQRNYQGGYANDQYAPGYARDCGRDQQNQQANNIAGVLLGALGGFPITHQLDCSDRNYAEPTYSRGLEGPLGQSYDWRNERDNDRGNFTPTREYNGRNNYRCRNWVSTTYRHGRRLRSKGSACRHEDGNWYFQ
jgi:surface antigen